ncbi:uncharacterized protein LOC100374329 [Saccoglossus kowalevskii]|uniref:Uncharacterized protein LOC100374329 n=1 Tax=Saccoglossus kowalevskii TaxID=10224 RepID=A0ABM0GUZ4_SACKO|nr:PREDICTED: uncharacterized protein LOC100374329 [Saccoglossus kowalevskii]
MNTNMPVQQLVFAIAFFFFASQSRAVPAIDSSPGNAGEQFRILSRKIGDLMPLCNEHVQQRIRRARNIDTANTLTLECLPDLVPRLLNETMRQERNILALHRDNLNTFLSFVTVIRNDELSLLIAGSENNHDEHMAILTKLKSVVEQLNSLLHKLGYIEETDNNIPIDCDGLMILNDLP